jgi:hypothetical protein
MNKRNMRPALAPRYIRPLCVLFVLLCSLLQLVISAAPVGADISEPGEWGVVTVKTVSPAGDPVVTDIGLMRIIDGAEQLYAYNVEPFTIEAQVLSGSYVAYAYKNGALLAKTDVFEVARHDHKQLALEVSTVEIRSFGVQPEARGSGELSQVQITYSLVNLEKVMANAEVRLTVTLNGALLETVPIVSVSSFPLGTSGEPFYYTPATSWREGEYGFSLQFHADGQLQAETSEQTLKVGGGGGLMSWLWIVIVILGVLAALTLGFLAFFLLKKRKTGQKPARADKKRHEQKPVSKAEEPASKPEPAPPAEPVRHLEEPVQGEEPIVQPKPLSSVSTLKARMTALGRDQGIVEDADEEPDTGNKGSSASKLKARMDSLGKVKDTDKGPDADNKGSGQAGK